jgi:hypothetical protein
VYYYRRAPPPASGERAPLLPNGPPVELAQTRAPRGAAGAAARYAGLLAAVLLAGAGAWAAAPRAPPGAPETVLELKSQVLGWLSAASYRACARGVGQGAPG